MNTHEKIAKGREKYDRRTALARAGHFELHLSPLDSDGQVSMSSKFGKAIRAIGGEYGDVRGYTSKRAVFVPMTPAGIDMAIDLLALYPVARKGDALVIERYSNRPAIVRYVHGLTSGQVETMLQNAVARAAKFEREDLEAEEARRAAEAAARPGKLRDERARLLARLAEIDAELGAE